MEYHEAANFLFDLRRYPSRTGVAPTRRLLDYLGGPGEDLRIVQVGGSNGKGSTARMVESVLREAGYDVGLYTSPHLDDVRERIRINGRPVTKRAVCEYVADVRPYVRDQAPDGEPPTFFEAVTGLAIRTFARENVDIAVLEVGIGGRYDATSALSPDAAAVTNVTLEHADLLGDTIEEIARDKAAIAPDGRALVTAADGTALEAITEDVGETLRVGTAERGGDGRPTTAAGTGADDTDDPVDVFVDTDGRAGVEQDVTVVGDGWRVGTKLPLLGEHQCRNAGVAAALCRQITDATTADIERGLRNAHWPGRFEVMERAPLVVLDGAHNPGSCAGVTGTLSTFEYDDLHLVFGAMADKDIPAMVAELPAAAVAYACRPEIGRAEMADSVAAVLEADGRAGRIERAESVTAAVESALAAAGPGDAVVVCGSLFVVAEARRRWTESAIRSAVPDAATASGVLERADVATEAVERVRGEGVHEVVTVRVSPHGADRIAGAFRSVGGECAVSAVEALPHERVEAVLMGTHAQFDRLLDVLAERSPALSTVADGIEDELADGIEDELADGVEDELADGVEDERDTGDDPDADGNEPAQPWADGTAVMGILNVTPDSFYDGGRYEALEDALDRAERLVEAGADVVDVGGESTRPNADPVSVEAELDRVVPVVDALADVDVAVSVDTRKAAVARAALDAGADVLNDVSGLEDPEMRLVAAEHDVPVVVMHSINTPVDPDADIAYDDVVSDTLAALEERVLLAEKAGLDRSQIIVDPGLGFGKSATESFELLGRLGEFRSLGCPVLVGHSRKSMFGLVERGDADERLAATVAASALAAERGADIVRVHDVAENVAAVKTAAAAEEPGRFRE